MLSRPERAGLSLAPARRAPMPTRSTQQKSEGLLWPLSFQGDSFMASIDGASLGEIFKPAHWEKIRREGINVLQRLLDLPIPVIGVANGPATVHSEYLLLADVHIASERATYGDFPHPAFGITAGDGLQVVWEKVVGPMRAKWLLWSGETIDAQMAERWGVVTEVLPHV